MILQEFDEKIPPRNGLTENLKRQLLEMCVYQIFGLQYFRIGSFDVIRWRRYINHEDHLH